MKTESYRESPYNDTLKRLTKKINPWGILMLMIMVLPMLVACGGDDDENGNTLPFSKEMLVGPNCYWGIKDIQGSHSWFYKNATAEFYADGTCNGFHSMETAYRITDGKLYTYHASTNEPMFVYTLLSRYKDTNRDELTIRVDGTLDDNSSFTIVMEKCSKLSSIE